jgi:uncharacterized protein (TIGR03581 family)
MSVEPNYLEDRICLNVLANSVENAKTCYEAAEGHVVLGVLSKNYESDEAAIKDMKKISGGNEQCLVCWSRCWRPESESNGLAYFW